MSYWGKVDSPDEVVEELENEIRAHWHDMHDARKKGAYGDSPEMRSFDQRWALRCKQELMTLLDIRRSGIRGACRYRPIHS